MYDFETFANIVDQIDPIKFEDGSQREPQAVIFEDGSFLATSHEAAQVAAKWSRKIVRWADKGRTDKIERFFNKGFDSITGL